LLLSLGAPLPGTSKAGFSRRVQRGCEILDDSGGWNWDYETINVTIELASPGADRGGGFFEQSCGFG
jgi:hypothetical protein